MKKLLFVVLVVLGITGIACAGPLDDLMKGMKVPAVPGVKSTSSAPEEKTVVSGLKEALSIGTGNAVASASKMDGYLKNQAIKILLPENIQNIAGVLGKMGYQKEVDDFTLSMNRAAEAAAPKAKKHFVDAIRQMSFEDAMNILKGGNTAATDYFKSKTFNKLYDEFKPSVSESMNKVGVTKSYKELTGRASSIPFVSLGSLDLDQYVTTKALDGLFYMVGQEETKIRTQPAARVTDLLKTVFGK